MFDSCPSHNTIVSCARVSSLHYRWRPLRALWFLASLWFLAVTETLRFVWGPLLRLCCGPLAAASLDERMGVPLLWTAQVLYCTVLYAD